QGGRQLIRRPAAQPLRARRQDRLLARLDRAEEEAPPAAEAGGAPRPPGAQGDPVTAEACGSEPQSRSRLLTAADDLELRLRAERRCPCDQRCTVEGLAVQARGQASIRRQSRGEELAGGRQRRLAVLAETCDAVVGSGADVLRQLEIGVLQIAARAQDRLARA